MTIVTEAIYEDGVLKPTVPLPLKDRERVRVTVENQQSWVQRTQRLLRWTGDVDELDRFALDPSLEPQESA